MRLSGRSKRSRCQIRARPLRPGLNGCFSQASSNGPRNQINQVKSLKHQEYFYNNEDAETVAALIIDGDKFFRGDATFAFSVRTRPWNS
jgi:hypothetical protein